MDPHELFLLSVFQCNFTQVRVFGLWNMRITKSFQIENDRRGYQEVCSDCKAYGLKRHGLTRSDYTGIL